MIRRNIIIFFFGALAIFSCNSDSGQAVVDKSVIPLPLQQALEAHGGLSKWQSFNTLGFTMMKDGKAEMHQIDLPSRKVKIDHENFTLGYDGEEVWVSPNLAAFGTGSARFYHNLYFYFFAMPYVVADPGINYKVLPDRTFNGKTYDIVQVGYQAKVGDAPDDIYILYLDKETHLLHVLLYTVTYYSKAKSEKYNAIVYDDWISVKGLKLPGSFKGYQFNDGKLGKLRYERIFLDHYLNEEPLIPTIFNQMVVSEIDFLPFMSSIENSIMNLNVPDVSIPSKKKILKKIRVYLKNEFEQPQEAFDHFDQDSNSKLSKAEIKKMLSAADVGGFFLSLISKTMVNELDGNGDEEVDWPEFKTDVEKLMAAD